MKRYSTAAAVLTLLIPVLLSAQVIAYDYSNLYEKVNPAVVTITTDGGSGSGFLVSSGGHIATNFHVIRGSRYLAVQFASGRKVKATVVAVNPRFDMALLKVNSAVVEDIDPLSIIPAEQEDRVKVGIPVVAFGSPLSQKFMMTQGILSKVDDETLMGDFLLQPGNSGGPLLTTEGQVVGINTFGDGNIAGAVRIGTLRAFVASTRMTETLSIEPSSSQLPALNANRYPVYVLSQKIENEALNPAAYKLRAGDFDVTIITPVLLGKLKAMSHKARANNRSTAYDSLDEPYYEWRRSTDSTLDFAVTFDVRPDTGPTPQGKLTRVLGQILKFGRGGKGDMEFKADFSDLRIYRDGELIEPVTPGRSLIAGDTDKKNPFIGEAYSGSYAYSPDEFLKGGEFRLQIIDARKPDEVYQEIVVGADSRLIQQLRSDFSYTPQR